MYQNNRVYMFFFLLLLLVLKSSKFYCVNNYLAISTHMYVCLYNFNLSSFEKLILPKQTYDDNYEF